MTKGEQRDWQGRRQRKWRGKKHRDAERFRSTKLGFGLQRRQRTTCFKQRF